MVAGHYVSAEHALAGAVLAQQTVQPLGRSVDRRIGVRDPGLAGRQTPLVELDVLLLRRAQPLLERGAADRLMLMHSLHTDLDSIALIGEHLAARLAR